MYGRRDVRYSRDHQRFSFDVDVAGPFISEKKSKRKKKPRMRNVSTQVMMMDQVVQDAPDWEEIGSQTDFPDWWDEENIKAEASEGEDEYEGEESGREGKVRTRSRGSSQGEYEQGAGDASSSSHSHTSESHREQKRGERDLRGKDGGDRKPPPGAKRGSAGSRGGASSKSARAGSKGSGSGKSLERKESKRREAETMARPRGYKDLNLKEQAIIVTLEAETYVTSHDLDKETAKQRGYNLSKDNILWPVCQDFDSNVAIKKIEDYIKRCWNLDPKWLFVVQLSEVYHDNFKRKYVYEVKFSIPTPTTPVPHATASVFFVLEVPISSAKNETVKVTYVVEGTRFPHRPGKIPFQDKWLQNVITDKQRIQKLVNF